MGLLVATSLFGQYGHHRFSWQESCFNNFSLPYCQGRDFGIKQPKGKNGSSRGVGGEVDFPATNVTAAEVVAGAIDWRFADPSAETLVGFHAKKLAALPLGRKMVAHLETSLGLAPVEIDSLLERLSGAEQVAISVGQNQTVMMVTARESDSTPPPLEPGWKATPVYGNALLIGQAEAVDQAVQRIAKNDPPGEMMRLAMRRQANNELWVLGFPGQTGPEAGSPKVQGFSLELSNRDGFFISDLALEYSAPPDAKTLGTWAAPLKAAVDGNVVHASTTIESHETEQKLGLIVASPIGEHLTALAKPTRYLPIHDASVPKQEKPKIYGLD